MTAGIVTSSVGIQGELFLDGLGIRPTDGKIFATPGGFLEPFEILTVDDEFGVLTSIGTPFDPNNPGVALRLNDLTFRPEGITTPEPTTLALIAIGLAGLGFRRWTH